MVPTEVGDVPVFFFFLENRFWSECYSPNNSHEIESANHDERA